MPCPESSRARVVVVPWLPPGVAGLTLRRLVMLRRGYEADEDLICHEMVHVRQWLELGVPRFLWRYLSAYARGRLSGLGHQAAYRGIPLEVEARRIAGR